MTNIDNIAQKIVDETLNNNTFMMQLDIDTLLVKRLHKSFPNFELKSWHYYLVLKWDANSWKYKVTATDFFEKELIRLYPEALI